MYKQKWINILRTCSLHVNFQSVAAKHPVCCKTFAVFEHIKKHKTQQYKNVMNAIERKTTASYNNKHGCTNNKICR